MTQTETTILHSYSSSQPMRLDQAVESCQNCLEGAIALLYSPSSCQIAKLSETQLIKSDGSVIDSQLLEDVFEARVFNQNCELRWLNRLDGEGEAVLLSESEQSIQGFYSHEPIKCERLQQQYLLWGEATNTVTTQGWQRLAEARIGKLDIPLDGKLKEKQRVYLWTLEYLAKIDDNFGNFSVIEERLVKLEAK
ncbi:MAG: TIGR03984 family CRISPR-associated protein [Arthrospira sp. PLM2.Bin9]|nr:CRISPR-associated protein Csx19 [Arthrospira sp. PLM2.Bin9]TVU52890.1 MAG: TIGR03984 family CRISPR-associated protein [Arthrospira sp. PLM2.Bin9]